MRRRRNRTPMAAIDQINVTPLLDLTFLLLIAFMITMPLMEYGTTVTPPEMNGEELPEDNFITVSVSKDDTFMLDDKVLSKAELTKRLKDIYARDPKTEILVKGDSEQSYGGVLELLKLVRSCGFKDAVLVTRAEGK